jgi:beta-lactamase class A
MGRLPQQTILHDPLTATRSMHDKNNPLSANSYTDTPAPKSPRLLPRPFLDDGSPFEVEFDPNGPLAAKAGETVTLRELVRLMITRSDNVATDLVMERVGAARVMDLLGSLGIENVIVRCGVEDPKAYEAGINNECSARGMLDVLIACRNSEGFLPESRRQMMQILRAQELSSMIGRGIPADSGAVVAHKTGSISWVEHDAGIVELRGGGAYVLVILTHSFGPDWRKCF